MGLFRTEAFVLRTVDFSESTQIAHLLSLDRGKFSAMARGVKRFKSRLGPRLEPFTLIDARVYLKESAAIGNLSSAELVRDWPFLRRDLRRYALAALVMETIDRGAPEGKPAGELFRLALEFLAGMEAAPDPESLAAHGLLRTLCLLGYAPDLREPAVAAAAWLFYLPDEGRLSPAPPSDSRMPVMRLEKPVREFLRQSMGLRAAEFNSLQAPREQTRPALAFLINLARFCLETDLRSVRFLRKMIWEKGV